MNSRRQALRDAAVRLAASGASDAALDAEWLLADVLGLPRLTMLLDADAKLSPDESARYGALLARRAAGDPLQYVLGEAHFMGRAFRVDARVLIPRGDTELLAEEAVRRLSPGRRMLDIGTGSGALAITAALACPGAAVTAVDISADALAVARANGERLGAGVKWVQSDLFTALSGQIFDLIVSNPPYIQTADLPALQPEVRREPALALDGGTDGLAFYRRIVAGLPDHLAPGGALLLEVGDGQAGDVAGMLSAFFATISIARDLNHLDRVVTGDGYAG